MCLGLNFFLGFSRNWGGSGIFQGWGGLERPREQTVSQTRLLASRDSVLFLVHDLTPFVKLCTHGSGLTHS